MGGADGEMEASDRAIEVTVFGRTDVGLVREHNEDNFLVARLDLGSRSLLPEVRAHRVGSHGTLLAVCDGMGGAAAGEVASQRAVDRVFELMRAGEPPSSAEDLALRLEEAVLDAGREIYAEARANRARQGMGTTITAAALVDERMVFAQVGDSRAYVIRDGKIVLATRDQSLVNQLIEAGQLKPEEAELFEHSNIILQALGTSEDVSVDLTFVDLRRGDLVVLCSDGLSGLVSDERIRQVVLESAAPIDACKALTEAAREGGGHDNITVIVARFEGEGLRPPEPGELVEFRRLPLPGREPPKAVDAPKVAGLTDDEARDDEDDEPSEWRGSARARGGGRREVGSASPVTMGIAVVAVLAVGVGLGYLVVTRRVEGRGGGETSAPAPDAASAFVVCNFTTNAPGARLIVDGQDYDEIPEGGLFIDLAPGHHSIEARRGSEVLVRQRLRLHPGQDQVQVFLMVEPAPAADADAPELDGTAELDGGDRNEGDDGGTDEATEDAAPVAAPPPASPNRPRPPVAPVYRPRPGDAAVAPDDRPRPGDAAVAPVAPPAPGGEDGERPTPPPRPSGPPPSPYESGGGAAPSAGEG